jgi:hypothetical protein
VGGLRAICGDSSGSGQIMDGASRTTTGNQREKEKYRKNTYRISILEVRLEK